MDFLGLLTCHKYVWRSPPNPEEYSRDVQNNMHVYSEHMHTFDLPFLLSFETKKISG
jgi:hypothetical protein